MQKVNVPGVGVVNFPDGMPPDQIQAAIERDILPKDKRAAPRETFDPTDVSEYPEATFGANMAAGAGKFISDAGLGLRQKLGLASREEIDAVKKRDKPLMDRREALVGNIGMGGLTTLPMAAIPGVNTLPGAAIAGGAIGALEPAGTGDSILKNTLIGGGLSMGAQAIGAAIPGLKAALYDPWFKKGQERIVGDMLRRSTSQPAEAAARMANPKEYVPNSRPTAAEASGDAGIASTQLAAASADPKTKEILTRQAIENNAARVAALREVAGDEASLAAAKGARDAAAKPHYDAAKAQTLKADDELKALMGRPSMKSAWERAQALAKERGEALVVGKDIPASVLETGVLDAAGRPITRDVAAQSAEYSGKGLHYLKMALDDAVGAPAIAGIGKNERAAIVETKNALATWMDRASPEYAAGRAAYAAKSQPVNQMQYGQELQKRFTPALMDVAQIEAPTRTRAEAFAAALRDSDASIKAATGRDLPLDKVLDPQAKEKVFGVAKDLARKAMSEDMAKTLGSTTAQNLSTKNILRQVGGPLGMPETWAESTALQSMFRPVSFATKNADQKIQERLAQALSDPRYGAQLMMAAQGDPAMMKLALALREYLPISAASVGTNLQ